MYSYNLHAPMSFRRSRITTRSSRRSLVPPQVESKQRKDIFSFPEIETQDTDMYEFPPSDCEDDASHRVVTIPDRQRVGSRQGQRNEIVVTSRLRTRRGRKRKMKSETSESEDDVIARSSVNQHRRTDRNSNTDEQRKKRSRLKDVKQSGSKEDIVTRKGSRQNIRNAKRSTRLRQTHRQSVSKLEGESSDDECLQQNRMEGMSKVTTEDDIQADSTTDDEERCKVLPDEDNTTEDKNTIDDTLSETEDRDGFVNTTADIDEELSKSNKSTDELSQNDVELEDQMASGDIWPLDHLFKSFPGRSNEIRLLRSLFGEPGGQAIVPAVFVSGPPASGKTVVVHSVLEQYQGLRAFVDCLECHSMQLLTEAILNQLSGTILSKSNGYSSYSSCTNLSDFLRVFKRVIGESGRDETVYVVVDRAERLRDMDSSVLSVLLRLNELTGANVCVVLISRVSWETFFCETGFPHPVTLYFPNYSIADVTSILMLECPSDQPQSLFKRFINLLCRVFQIACSDLNEWRHLARNLFPKYIGPVLNGQVNETDTKHLWANIEPHFKSAMNHLFLPQVHSHQENKAELFDFSYNSKFLLIAAYLASYNPMNTDKRFFTKKGERLSKRQKHSKKSVKKSKKNNPTGPKPFPLNRLLAIFRSIVKQPSRSRADLLQQISSLVSRGCLHLQNSDQIDIPRFKCSVSLDMIQAIAKSVKFEVTKYLYDM